MIFWTARVVVSTSPFVFFNHQPKERKRVLFSERRMLGCSTIARNPEMNEEATEMVATKITTNPLLVVF